jgi:hypothetical protein
MKELDLSDPAKEHKRQRRREKRKIGKQKLVKRLQLTESTMPERSIMAPAFSSSFGALGVGMLTASVSMATA